MTNKVTKHKHSDKYVAKHKNNGKLRCYAQEQWQKTMISIRTMQMSLLSTRTIPNVVAKHKNNSNEAAK